MLLMTRRSVLVLALVFTLANIFSIPSAYAQGVNTSPKIEVKVTYGIAYFDENRLDDRHQVWGGSFRYYFSPRVSVEPEILYMRHTASDQDLVISPNVALDMRRPGARFNPYFTTGVGVIHHWEKTRRITSQNQPVVETSSATKPNFTFGFGIKIFVTKHLYISPELRFGAEPILRETVSVGYVLSERKRLNPIR